MHIFAAGHRFCIDRYVSVWAKQRGYHHAGNANAFDISSIISVRTCLSSLLSLDGLRGMGILNFLTWLSRCVAYLAKILAEGGLQYRFPFTLALLDLRNTADWSHTSLPRKQGGGRSHIFLYCKGFQHDTLWKTRKSCKAISTFGPRMRKV